jgi:hypothetical protein
MAKIRLAATEAAATLLFKAESAAGESGRWGADALDRMI